MTGATRSGTRDFLTSSLKNGAASEHFRDVHDWKLSSVGLGTHLGDHDEETDALYRGAVVEAVSLGCNFLDSAINYRCQRSERAIGAALKELTEKGIPREQIVVATKGGYIPFDGAPPSSAADYLKECFLEPGILDASDLVGGHSLRPSFLRQQLETSRENLGVETVDIYYLHNPEAQLAQLDRATFHGRLRSAFELMETLVQEGKTTFYGTASWNGYRVDPSAKDFLSLHDIAGLAREVAGDDHHFRFIQAPYNLGMPEVLTAWNQRDQSLAQAAVGHGVHVIVSASLGQGQLTQGIPEWLGTLFRGCDTQAQLALQFARSTPGVTAALVGMKNLEHVRENLVCARMAPAPAEDVLKLFEVDSEGI